MYRNVPMLLGLWLTLVCVPAMAQAPKMPPMTRTDLLQIFQSGGLTEASLVNSIGFAGVDFQLSKKDEAEFRKLEVPATIIEAVKKNYRPKQTLLGMMQTTTPPVEPTARIRATPPAPEPTVVPAAPAPAPVPVVQQAPTPAPQPVIDKTFETPVLIRQTPPAVPPNVMKMIGRRMQIAVKAKIDETGRVVDAVPPESPSGQVEVYLGNIAVQTVKLWRFQPAKRDGQPVKSEWTVVMSFAPPVAR